MIAGGKRYLAYKSRSLLTEIHLWAMGDWHLGNKDCARGELANTIKEIADDPMAVWLGMGDYAEYIGVGDPRFDPLCFDSTLSISDLGTLGTVLSRQVRDLMMPIRHKCLGLLFGNHEAKYMKYSNQQQLHAWLCTELGVSDLGYSTLFRLTMARISSIKVPLKLGLVSPKVIKKVSSHHGGSRWTLTIFAHHGAGAAATRGGKMQRLEKFMKQHDADLYFTAHLHEKMPLGDDKIGISPDGSRLESHQTLGTITGSYLRTYGDGYPGYGEIRGYSPTSLGAAMVTLTPATKGMKLSVSAKAR